LFLCVSLTFILINLTSFMSILNAIRMLCKTSPLMNHGLSWSLQIPDLLSRCRTTHIFIQCMISAEYLISSSSVTSNSTPIILSNFVYLCS
jgi:hypothetical protein